MCFSILIKVRNHCFSIKDRKTVRICPVASASIRKKRYQNNSQSLHVILVYQNESSIPFRVHALFAPKSKSHWLLCCFENFSLSKRRGSWDINEKRPLPISRTIICEMRPGEVRMLDLISIATCSPCASVRRQPAQRTCGDLAYRRTALLNQRTTKFIMVEESFYENDKGETASNGMVEIVSPFQQKGKRWTTTVFLLLQGIKI